MDSSFWSFRSFSSRRVCILAFDWQTRLAVDDFSLFRFTIVSLGLKSTRPLFAQ